MLIASILLFTSACSTNQNSTTPEPEPIRQAAITDVAKTVVSSGFDAYKFIKSCIKNKELGLACNASDGDNIRRTLQEVRELRDQIMTNQSQVMGEFDSMRSKINNNNIKESAIQLQSMIVNVDAAEKAYEALALCAVATTDECVPYDGSSNAQPLPIDEAVQATQAYFIEKAANMPQDILLTASWFTGTEGRPNDGLAAAIWVYNKGIQDSQAGITDTKMKDAMTVPVVSAAIATKTNRDLKYWTEFYSKYAFFIVMYRGLNGNESLANRAQNEVNNVIADSEKRSSVLGAANAYAFPQMNETGMVLYADDKAWIVEPGQSTLGAGRRALVADDLVKISTVISSYAPVESFAASVTSAMPADRWYAVKTPVKRVRYDWYQNYIYPKVNNYEATWLSGDVQQGDSSGVCPTKVRPVNTAISRPSNVLNSTIKRSGASGDRWIVQFRPAVDPDNLFVKTWEQFAKDRPIEYAWKTEPIFLEGIGSSLMGWGAWVSCTTDAYDSHIEMGYVPAGMGATS